MSTTDPQNTFRRRLIVEALARVHDLTADGDAAGRLSVVSELCPAHESISDGYAPFLPDAVAMRGEWRTPTADELADLIGTPNRYHDADVVIVRVPRLAQALRNHLEKPDDYAYVH